MTTVGIIANPASGKDVRRLVARASVFDNQEKRAIVRRALAGLLTAAPDCRIAYLDDPHGIVAGALADAGAGHRASPVEATRTGSALDTISAARSLKEADCRVVLTLGGDGTNRAVALGWAEAPLIAVSTGTNNVFPGLVEATVAGAAAGLVAAGEVAVEEAAHQSKLVRVAIDGERDDLALVDAVLSRERFVGSRALLSPERIRLVLLTRARPAAVGMTALGGLMAPLDDAEDAALLLELADDGEAWQVPIAPGYYQRMTVSQCRRIALGEAVSVEGAGVLAFDGERERMLRPDQRARLWVERSGPRVIDVARTLELAAARGSFRAAPALP